MAEETVAVMSEAGQARQLREEMTDSLMVDGWITRDIVEDAFRAVPREKFCPPGTPLADCYPGDKAVITKKDANGRNISSVSAPWLQAKMIDQAGVESGMRVLEIGSGGCNAAILSEVVGRSGLVVSVDIDVEISTRATAALRAAGYESGRVKIVTADAEHGVPGLAPYDAILVTVGAWDVPPAWTGQLRPGGGRLVVPLRMNSVTRTIGFRPDGDHLVSDSAQVSGFVPIQGRGIKEATAFELDHPAGGKVTLKFEDWAPERLEVPPDVLGTTPAAAYPGVTIGEMQSFADLQLKAAGFPGFCRLEASSPELLAGPPGDRKKWFPMGRVGTDSFAYFWLNPIEGADPKMWEFATCGYGPRAQDAADELAEIIREWDRAGRDLPENAFSWWPAGSDTSAAPPDAVVFPRHHGSARIRWLQLAKGR